MKKRAAEAGLYDTILSKHLEVMNSRIPPPAPLLLVAGPPKGDKYLLWISDENQTHPVCYAATPPRRRFFTFLPIQHLPILLNERKCLLFSYKNSDIIQSIN